MVTEVDRAAEAYIRRELARQRPDDAVLGEEAGRRSGSSGVRWFVDPIDGTVNFVLGLPQYAVSIAAQVDGRVVAACVHNPVSRELFHATLGSGAFAGERGRRRSSQRFCRALPTSAASARPRSICARSPPGGSTRTSRQG